MTSQHPVCNTTVPLMAGPSHNTMLTAAMTAATAPTSCHYHETVQLLRQNLLRSWRRGLEGHHHPLTTSRQHQQLPQQHAPWPPPPTSTTLQLPETAASARDGQDGALAAATVGLVSDESAYATTIDGKTLLNHLKKYFLCSAIKGLLPSK